MLKLNMELGDLSVFEAGSNPCHEGVACGKAGSPSFELAILAGAYRPRGWVHCLHIDERVCIPSLKGDGRVDLDSLAKGKRAPATTRHPPAPSGWPKSTCRARG